MAADPLTAIDMALAEIAIATAALDRLGRALAELRQVKLDNRLSLLPPCEVPVIEGQIAQMKRTKGLKVGR